MFSGLSCSGTPAVNGRAAGFTTQSRSLMIIAFVSLSGCHSWQRVPGPGVGGALASNPKIVQVTRTFGCAPAPTPQCGANQVIVTLHNPAVDGDSLIGYRESNQRGRMPTHVRDVVDVRLRQINRPVTTALAFGTAAIVGVALFVVVSLGSLGPGY